MHVALSMHGGYAPGLRLLSAALLRLSPEKVARNRAAAGWGAASCGGATCALQLPGRALLQHPMLCHVLQLHVAVELLMIKGGRLTLCTPPKHARGARCS